MLYLLCDSLLRFDTPPAHLLHGATSAMCCILQQGLLGWKEVQGTSAGPRSSVRHPSSNSLSNGGGNYHASMPACMTASGDFVQLLCLSSLSFLSPVCFWPQRKIWVGLDVFVPVFYGGTPAVPPEPKESFLCSKRLVTSAKWRKHFPVNSYEKPSFQTGPIGNVPTITLEPKIESYRFLWTSTTIFGGNEHKLRLRIPVFLPVQLPNTCFVSFMYSRSCRIPIACTLKSYVFMIPLFWQSCILKSP